MLVSMMPMRQMMNGKARAAGCRCQNIVQGRETGGTCIERSTMETGDSQPSRFLRTLGIIQQRDSAMAGKLARPASGQCTVPVVFAYPGLGTYLGRKRKRKIKGPQQGMTEATR